MNIDACPVDLDGYSALLDARNNFVTVHLALLALADTAPDHSDAILSVERVFDEALGDLDRALKLNERPPSPPDTQT
jgi:hypothetical protein